MHFDRLTPCPPNVRNEDREDRRRDIAVRSVDAPLEKRREDICTTARGNAPPLEEVQPMHEPGAVAPEYLCATDVRTWWCVPDHEHGGPVGCKTKQLHSDKETTTQRLICTLPWTRCRTTEVTIRAEYIYWQAGRQAKMVLHRDNVNVDNNKSQCM